ncbi:MAG: translation elongation factor 4 [Candidatus Omnitrophica bacterium]|nr:translation elongation factor 4 [Candidatus Omnitrophota bacterium]MCF7877519.1 translation elongation factor 4 [Candidatus Omnitrophota bacterium]MCF7878426.1 translation elongation factor 4 [Candidatus Omnitrophota bacterium]MCF7892929.1 translation elongation factor 4 [Candidatus Omnitrophota bacterium]
MEQKNNTRNFCIIAHIDHGKSTLADRFLEIAGTMLKGKISQQMLDSMELERERGITIKAKAVRLIYSSGGASYTLNLIDTPGHVDFSYEVAKSLKGCEGAILLVDAAQGVEAQTVANFHLALESNLKIIPVLNKIDLPGADLEKGYRQLFDIFGFKKEEVLAVSAKEGAGVKKLLDKLIEEIPAPSGDPEKPTKAVLFDSAYDLYRGVVLFVRIFDGKIKKGDRILLMHQKKEYRVEEIGIFCPQPVKKESLACGQVGYICCNMKNPNEVDVGDTITLSANPASSPFESYQKMSPMVFAGIFPSSSQDYVSLREAIEKLNLSDSSFSYEPDSLGGLGHGFRCGFLGLLHMDIIQERLEREYNLDLIVTSPNVKYKIKEKGFKKIREIESAHQFPDLQEIDQVYEPFVTATIMVPVDFIDSVCDLAKSRRGNFKKMDYLGKDRLNIIFDIPLSEIVIDFYDKIKSVTRGYGSFDYEFTGYKETDIVQLDILFNQKKVDAFSLLVHRTKAESKGRAVVEKLKELIPRQMYEVKVQAAIGSKIIASAKVRAMKKNVTAKCYGGDVSRKRKLWEKQKKGKKKMKQLGNVSVPRGAFLEVLKM